MTLRSGTPLTLVPYDAAREISLVATDLRRIAEGSRAGRWVVARAGGWLEYWREDIGRDGFYPFDLVGAAFVLRPELFRCARAPGWIGEDQRMWGWFRRPMGFLVDVAPDSERAALALGEVTYCPELTPELHGWLVAALSSAGSGAGNHDAPRRR